MDIDFSLDNKAVLVTGGASGIGWAICQLFAGRGARIAIADLNTDSAAERARALGGRPRRTAWTSPTRIR
ncbi:hypothetical protein GCM10027613_44470 [Microlunatus endophyticus]